MKIEDPAAPRLDANPSTKHRERKVLTIHSLSNVESSICIEMFSIIAPGAIFFVKSTNELSEEDVGLTTLSKEHTIYQSPMDWNNTTFLSRFEILQSLTINLSDRLIVRNFLILFQLLSLFLFSPLFVKRFLEVEIIINKKSWHVNILT